MKQALVVEDLGDVRDWLAEIARAAFPGLVVSAVGRAEDGIAAAATQQFDLALVDLGLPDGSGMEVVRTLAHRQPQCLAVVVTIYDDDGHLFPALQAGAFGYLLKEQPREALTAQLLRIAQGEPPLSPPIARRVLSYFGQGARVPAVSAAPLAAPPPVEGVRLTERETVVLQRVAKGYTLPEIAQQLGLSRHTIADHIKQIYRKLDVSSRAEATLEAARRGLVRP
ncbi:MAG TPA: response regulator transcription factor [Ramlibacter sp.]|jgi:DNA-binding NarL/FixJ family response regulator|uniref:response regulator transcription factor n=1 Tax=Ramlibacter sp. TaxID=1917967 RepID=UPI002D3F783C|nr:response regulator transcription factor [Ramlibacter sp.]HZY19877.1 response regulator transcription factor [Ramlibacter sp.]